MPNIPKKFQTLTKNDVAAQVHPLLWIITSFSSRVEEQFTEKSRNVYHILKELDKIDINRANKKSKLSTSG